MSLKSDAPVDNDRCADRHVKTWHDDIKCCQFDLCDPERGDDDDICWGYSGAARWPIRVVHVQCGAEYDRNWCCFDVAVSTTRSSALVDIGILTSADFARWQATNYSTNYSFVDGTFCSDSLACKKSVIVPDRAPVLLVHNTDVAAFSVIVKLQEAACPELFSVTSVITTPTIAPLSSTAGTLTGSFASEASTCSTTLVLLVCFLSLNWHVGFD